MRRLFRLPWRSNRRIGADVDDELRFHLDMRADELIAAGMTPEAARSEALRQFGDLDDARSYLNAVDRSTEAEQRRTEYMSDLRQDIVYAARKLRGSPAFTITAILTLALGIGANTAILSVVNGVLLKPLPFAKSHELMRIEPYTRGELDAAAPPDLADHRTLSRAFEGFAMVTGENFNLVREDADPELLNGVFVSANWFDLLRQKPMLGRTFLPGEDREGAPKVVLLSHALWSSRFNADPHIVGRAIRLNGEDHTVVGVLPAHQYPLTPQLFVPLVFDARQLSDAFRGARWLGMIGRVKSGVDAETASRDVQQISRQIEARFPETYKYRTERAIPLHDAVVRQLQRPLVVIMGAVAFVLLIACANVANLFLVRAAGREGELVIRTALGAGRARLARQLVTESLLLSLAGAALGVVLARWGMHAILDLAPRSLPQIAGASIDGTVLGVTAAIAICTGVVFGVLPALPSTGLRGELAAALRAGSRAGRARPSANRMKRTIVIAEVALAVTLLVGAGLLLRSFERLLSVDPGFRSDGVMTFRVSAPDRSYPDDGAMRRLEQALLPRLQSIPGVKQAAFANGLPLDGSDMTITFTIRGRAPVPESEQPAAQIVTTTPDFFAAMGIPILQGRSFTRDDRWGAPQVAVISKEFARRFFPNEDPIGKYVELGWSSNGNRRGGVIVGIAGNVKQTSLDREGPVVVYLPFAQAPQWGLRVVLRTAVDPASVTNMARAAVRETDREMPVFALRTLKEHVEASVGAPRFYAVLITIFAGVALVLAAVGLYGVIAYAVGQRNHELGIRIALGATSDRIARMVVSQGIALALGGVALGVVGALTVARVLRTLLFGVSPTDPVAFSVAALLLVLVAGIASFLPARRAARADPLVTMRGD
jgi:predicted permease